ncbi:MAG: diguanylate cyclase [Thiomonas sp.]
MRSAQFQTKRTHPNVRARCCSCSGVGYMRNVQRCFMSCILLHLHARTRPLQLHALYPRPERRGFPVLYGKSTMPRTIPSGEPTVSTHIASIGMPQATLEIPAGTRQAREQTARRIYPLRIIGMGLGGLTISGVLMMQHAAAWRWALMGLTCLVWPHVAYVWARLSRDSYSAEKRNLLIDSAIAGMWVPLMHFNLLPSVVLMTVTTFDKFSTGIRRLWLHSLPGLFAAAALVTLVLRPPVDLPSSLLVIVCTLPLLVVHTMSTAIGSYRLIRTVSRQNKLLEMLRRTDSQTGLFVRDHLLSEADAALQAFHASGQPACLLMIDIDRFKDINDTYGHVAGDEVISAAGRVIRECIRAEDSAGRYGGDEFAVLCRRTQADEGQAIAQRIQDGLKTLHFPDYPGLQVTSSIGLAQTQAGLTTLRAWIQSADLTLYAAKQRNERADYVQDAQ